MYFELPFSSLTLSRYDKSDTHTLDFIGKNAPCSFLSSSNPSLKAVVRNSFGRSRVMAAAKATHPSKSQPSVSIDLQKRLHTYIYRGFILKCKFFCQKKQHLVFNASPTPFRSGAGRFIFDNSTPKHLKIYFFANGGPKFVRWHQPLDSIKILERFQSGQKVPYPWSSRRTESLKLQSFMFMNFLGDRNLTKKSSVHSVK